MSSNEGRQSPPPETQTGPQLKDAPAQGQGVDKADNKSEDNKSQLEVSIQNRDSTNSEPEAWVTNIRRYQSLSSNPAGPLDEAVKEKFTKTQK